MKPSGIPEIIPPMLSGDIFFIISHIPTPGATSKLVAS